MFCSNCGNQLPKGSRFCPNCGTPILDCKTSDQSQNIHPASNFALFSPSQRNFPALTKLITGNVIWASAEIIAVLICISIKGEDDFLGKFIVSILIELIGAGVAVYCGLSIAKAINNLPEEQSNILKATTKKWKLPMTLIQIISVLALIVTAIRI